VDVGFSGEPVSLNVGAEPLHLIEGQFRVVPSKHNTDFHVLVLLVNNKDDVDEVDNGDCWRPLYEWQGEDAPLVDQIGWNWYSCTFPAAHFTTQLFAFRIVGRINKELITKKITTKAQLLELIDQVFCIKLVKTEGIDRYLL